MTSSLETNNLNLFSKDGKYLAILQEIKTKIRSAQIKAALSVNQELLKLYWEMGKIIVERQKDGKWGDSIVDMLAIDLRKEFPGIKGFSRANLFFIRKWYLSFSRLDQKVQQLVRQLPWGHIIVIINKIKDPKEAVFYVHECLANNWSRNMLVHQIESQLYKRKGTFVSNFERVLPKPQSDLAMQTLKDPYLFDFLTLEEEAQEKELEKGLTQQIIKFLLELGAGFSFVGAQYPLEISGKDYHLDLLFYHLNLRCFVILELKTGEFKPEYAGKVNFYLSAVDDTMKHSLDNPSIGLILCKSRDKVIAEYSLRDMSKPIGVSSYKIVKSVPKRLKNSLPTVKQIEEVFSR